MPRIETARQELARLTREVSTLSGRIAITEDPAIRAALQNEHKQICYRYEELRTRIRRDKTEKRKALVSYAHTLKELRSIPGLSHQHYFAVQVAMHLIDSTKNAGIQRAVTYARKLGWTL